MTKSVNNLMIEVCNEYGILLSDVQLRCRERIVVDPRKMIAYLLKEKSDFHKKTKSGKTITLKGIASCFNGGVTNHTTIIYYLDECKSHIETEDSTKRIYKRIKQTIAWKELLSHSTTQNSNG